MIDQLKLEVMARVDGLNDVVITEAFQNTSFVCPDCNYPQNHEEFIARHDAYAAAKLKLHRARRSNEICERTGRHWWALRSGCSGRSYADMDMESIYYTEAKNLRKYLKEVWPCEECIRRFNPTGRVAHPPPSLPERRFVYD